MLRIISPGLSPFGPSFRSMENNCECFEGTPFHAKALECLANEHDLRSQLMRLPITSLFSDKEDKNASKREKLQEQLNQEKANWVALEADLMRWKAAQLRKNDKMQKSYDLDALFPAHLLKAQSDEEVPPKVTGQDDARIRPMQKAPKSTLQDAPPKASSWMKPPESTQEPKQSSTFKQKIGTDTAEYPTVQSSPSPAASSDTSFYPSSTPDHLKFTKDDPFHHVLNHFYKQERPWSHFASPIDRMHDMVDNDPSLSPEHRKMYRRMIQNGEQQIRHAEHRRKEHQFNVQRMRERGDPNLKKSLFSTFSSHRTLPSQVDDYLCSLWDAPVAMQRKAHTLVTNYLRAYADREKMDSDNWDDKTQDKRQAINQKLNNICADLLNLKADALQAKSKKIGKSLTPKSQGLVKNLDDAMRSFDMDAGSPMNVGYDTTDELHRLSPMGERDSSHPFTRIKTAIQVLKSEKIDKAIARLKQAGE